MTRKVLITGAAGRLGSALREGLRGSFPSIHLTDRVPLTEVADGEVVTCADLADLNATLNVVRNVDVVVHAAGIPDEAPFEELVKSNIWPTHNVLEAARRNGVSRVVYLSSAHVVGYYPRSRTIDENVPLRPDTKYGVTKAMGEELARLYHDKYGIEVACLRIGSFRDRPQSVRQLSTWLSPRDAVHLVHRCIVAEQLGFAVLYGISANTRRFYVDKDSARIGFVPRDDAEAYAAEVGTVAYPDDYDATTLSMQGGIFASAHYVGGHG